MIVKILGSAAGGGFPQWNCNSRLSRMAWDGDRRVVPRTQSSIAVSNSGESWIVVNASPDIRQQIAQTIELQPLPSGDLRNSPIKALILTNGDIDHIAGLLSLRERQPFCLYATSRVLSSLASNGVFNVLASDVVERIPLTLGNTTEIAAGGCISVEPFPVPGKIALYLEDPTRTGLGTKVEDTIGLKINAPNSGTLFYIPGCATVDDEVRTRVQGAACLLFDGTLFTDAEMIELKVGDKTGQRMGHVPISGENGSLHAFDDATIAKKIYIHINTTNPILEQGSDAEAIVKAAGWDVAYDGMTLML